ncbi:MAG: iron-containing alcohol dehydrogenase [Candidatus Fimimonas sp.]
MKTFKKILCRTYQKAMYVGMVFMPWRQPELLQGVGCFNNVVDFLQKRNVNRPLVVCDKATLERKALDGFFASAQGKLNYTVFDGVQPNPTVKQAEQGAALFVYESCDGILAFGGGSSIDCAKAIGALIARPEKPISKMKGLLKVRKKLPTLVAVPTTAGTGSECTVAAVITDSETHDKYAINDFSLIPHYAVLDPVLTVGLPPFLTATTGMDALTHAVEAYVGRSNTSQTKRQAEEAVALIFGNLEECATNGNNLQARANMQEAAFLAGLAFTRAYVGYVHALAHALGGQYNIAHGLANAVLLPVVLKKYGNSVNKKLAKLAVVAKVASADDSEGIAAAKFVAAVEELNEKLGIPKNFDGKILAEDVPVLAAHAEKEANPLYPVPQLWDKSDFVEVLQKVK